MYPLSSSSVEMMLGEALWVEPSLENLENLENSEPGVWISCGNLNRSRRAVLNKKGGHRVRVQNRNTHNQQNHPNQNQAVVLRIHTDINNNNNNSPPSSDTGTTEPPDRTTPSRTTPSGPTHFNKTTTTTTTKNESKKGERGNQPSRASTCRAQKNRDRKRPLSSPDAPRNAAAAELSFSSEDNPKDAEKTYAGPKFSEPPSPSVLPKPPSHWVGQNTPRQSDSSREQMSVHLKTILKVQTKP